jgi:hypothetical protein
MIECFPKWAQQLGITLIDNIKSAIIAEFLFRVFFQVRSIWLSTNLCFNNKNNFSFMCMSGSNLRSDKNCYIWCWIAVVDALKGPRGRSLDGGFFDCWEKEKKMFTWKAPSVNQQAVKLCRFLRLCTNASADFLRLGTNASADFHRFVAKYPDWHSALAGSLERLSWPFIVAKLCQNLWSGQMISRPVVRSPPSLLSSPSPVVQYISRL